MAMDDAQRRLAAYAQEEKLEQTEPDEPEPEAEEPDEPLFKTVADVLRVTGGLCEPTVLGLKQIGALVDDGEWMCYTLHKPLKFPATTKVRLVRDIKGKHKFKMMSPGEWTGGKPIPLNQVFLSWVAAFADMSDSVVAELSSVDCDALMSVAQWIEADQGNR